MKNLWLFVVTVALALPLAVPTPSRAAGDITQDVSGLSGKELRSALRKMLVRDHKVSLDYTAARKVVVGELYAHHDKNGSYITDVYCLKDYPIEPGPAGAGKAGAPWIGTLNVEHTWPQSDFVTGQIKAMQKSDLHHLFPADKEMNNRRGNIKFGEVTGQTEKLKCDASRLGKADGGLRFEPPDSHKGNVARAMFYFAVRYSQPIDNDEEEVLKRWNHLDPVDEEESIRNDRIEQLQGNRNPFIDNPDLADQIGDL